MRLTAWLVTVTLLVIASGCTPEPPSPAPPEAPASPLQFTDVTAEAGLGDFRHENGARGDKWFPETMTGGVCVLDYDGDGWPDVLLTGGYVWPSSGDAPVRPLRLYRNQGDGTFRETTEAATLPLDPMLVMAAIPGDIDNDGDPDLYLTNRGTNVLLENRDGQFVDVTARAGVSGGDLWTTPALFFDADRDGWLDLLVGNYIDWSPEINVTCSSDGENTGYCTPEIYDGVQGVYFRNNRDGTFTDATETSGFASLSGKTLGLVAFDYDDDGWLDVAAANDTDPDQLFSNQGDGTFVEQGVSSGFAFDENGRARAGMGIDVGDVTGDGMATLFVGNFAEEMMGVYTHLGRGLFLERAAASQIGRPSLPTLTFGLFLFDPDLDGDLDVFAANGHLQAEVEATSTHITFRQPPHLFINDGTGRFTDAVPSLGEPLARPLVARGATELDYDRDGDGDIIVVDNEAGVVLLRNDSAGRSVTVRGGSPHLRLTGYLGSRVLHRQMPGANSYIAHPESAVTFGLDGATQLDSLHVTWPSGVVSRYLDLPADTTLYLPQSR
ncbi:MAG: CRTAC1 family protein [Bacteroidota bacterium]